MANEGMMSFSLTLGDNILTASGYSIDELIQSISWVQSSKLAMSFYQKEHKKLSDDQKRALANVIRDNGTFDELYKFFKLAPQFAAEIAPSINCTYFEYQASRGIRQSYKADHEDDMKPVYTVEELKAKHFVEFYKASASMVNPDAAILYCISMQVTGQAHVLIELLKLGGTLKDAVKEFLIEKKDLPGVIAFSEEIEKVDDKQIASIALDLANDEAEKDSRNKHLYTAICGIDSAEVGLLEQLAGAVISTCKDAEYASKTAAELYQKMCEMPEDCHMEILQSFLNTLEDITIENSVKHNDHLFLFLSEVATADRLKLYKAMRRVYKHTVKDASCWSYDCAIAKDYITMAERYISFKDQWACKLGLK